jgi:hypothetical protein
MRSKISPDFESTWFLVRRVIRGVAGLVMARFTWLNRNSAAHLLGVTKMAGTKVAADAQFSAIADLESVH